MPRERTPHDRIDVRVPDEVRERVTQAVNGEALRDLRLREAALPRAVEGVRRAERPPRSTPKPRRSTAGWPRSDGRAPGRNRSADEKAAEAARHAASRAQAIAATASLAAQAADGAGEIDIEKLADILGAEIVYGDLDGAKARVVQTGDRARIIISKKIVGVGAIRFCIAHEIGHLLLKALRPGASGRARH